jgi:hypothetical protein
VQLDVLFAAMRLDRLQFLPVRQLAADLAQRHFQAHGGQAVRRAG